MKKLLVTGASGFLGWHVCEAAKVSWHVVGTYCSHELVIAGVEARHLDMSDRQGMLRFLEEVSPDAVIHTAALSLPNDCEKNPDLSQALNVDATHELAQWCGQAEIPLVFTSTDLVFDGRNPPYDETTETCPVSVYGRHKVAAEQAVLEIPLGVTCRMPLMFGDRDGNPASFLGGHLAALKEGTSLSLFVDEFRTPVSGATAAKGLLLALKNNTTGILNLGGSERISRYDFGIVMAEVFGLPVEGIKAVHQADVTMAAARPPDVSLDSRKAFAFGYAPESIREQLTDVKKRMEI